MGKDDWFLFILILLTGLIYVLEFPRLKGFFKPLSVTLILFLFLMAVSIALSFLFPKEVELVMESDEDVEEEGASYTLTFLLFFTGGCLIYAALKNGLTSMLALGELILGSIWLFLGIVSLFLWKGEKEEVEKESYVIGDPFQV